MFLELHPCYISLIEKNVGETAINTRRGQSDGGAQLNVMGEKKATTQQNVLKKENDFIAWLPTSLQSEIRQYTFLWEPSSSAVQESNSLDFL